MTPVLASRYEHNILNSKLYPASIWNSSGPSGTRTPGRPVMSRLLLPTELKVHMAADESKKRKYELLLHSYAFDIVAELLFRSLTLQYSHWDSNPDKADFESVAYSIPPWKFILARFLDVLIALNLPRACQIKLQNE